MTDDRLPQAKDATWHRDQDMSSNKRLLNHNSDHSTPVATPLTQDSARQPREYVTKTYRPLPESGIREFGQWICAEE